MDATDSEAIAALETLKADLAGHGQAQRPDTSAVPLDVWRKLARTAGHALGRSVETTAWGSAHLRTWPATPEEEAIAAADLAALRESIGYTEPAPRPAPTFHWASGLNWKSR